MCPPARRRAEGFGLGLGSESESGLLGGKGRFKTGTWSATRTTGLRLGDPLRPFRCIPPEREYRRYCNLSSMLL